MDAAWWITTGIATWGATLATILAVRELTRRRGQARVRVGYSARGHVATQPFVLVATISNDGHQSLFLARAALDVRRLSMSSTRFVTAPPLPVELKPGQSYAADFDAEQVWAASSYNVFREARVVFYDQLGRSYASDFVPVGEPRKSADGWGLHLADPPTLGQRLRVRLSKRRAGERGSLSQLSDGHGHQRP